MLTFFLTAFLLAQTANDVKLSPDSPAIGAGANLGPPYNLILDPSNAAPYDQSVSGWMIGAFGGSPATFIISGAEVSGVITGN